jgi:glucokinase
VQTLPDERVIAMDLGGTKLLTGLVRRDGVVVHRTVTETEVRDQDQLLEQIDRCIDEYRSDAVVGIGIGIPSLIDQRTGRAVASVNVPLQGFDFRDHLAERFGLPVGIDYDANVAALAEHVFGAGRGARNMVMLTLGTGVGGGLILNGELFRGAYGAAAELGHMTIDIDGPPCQGTCPGIGHLEVLASGNAAGELARRFAEERPHGDLGRAAAEGRTVDAALAVELARESDGDAREVMRQIGRNLGIGIANFVNIFNPDLVVLGGGFSRAAELIVEPALEVVRERALAPSRDTVRIALAILGVEAGLIGAALVGYEAADASRR